jgi:uncharacterized membrane protein (DUF2068 family)
VTSEGGDHVATLGGTILSVLAIIGGILSLCGGIGLAFGGSALTGALAAAGQSSAVSAGALAVSGVIAIVVGVLYLVLGVGLFQLKGWAWMLGMALSIVSLVIAVFEIALKYSTVSSQLIGMVFSVIILVYLFTPGVRAAFGRS